MMMDLREKVIEILCDLIEIEGFYSHDPTQVAGAILAIPEIRGALASVALLEGERKIFANYRADLGRLLNRN
jgi:hypothetical protein